MMSDAEIIEVVKAHMEGKKIETYEPGIQKLLAASKALASE